MDILNLKKKTIQSDLPPVVTPETTAFNNQSVKSLLLDWNAEEFSYYEKSRTWFLIGGAIFFLVVGYFTITKQITTALTFLLLGLTIYIFSLKKPRKIRCQITNHSISADTAIYYFKEIESFWIFYEPPEFKVISLKHKKPYLPLIQIPLGETDPILVRRSLLQFLHEEEQEEGFSDKMARFLRF